MPAGCRPRGNGLKALLKIADGTKHREHFAALKELFPDADKSGVNLSRVCYESYDPEIYINEAAETCLQPTRKWSRSRCAKRYRETRVVFDNLLKWLANRNDAFVKGERNLFIFKLASACCRFGIHHDDALGMIEGDFTSGELQRILAARSCVDTVRKAYKSNGQRPAPRCSSATCWWKRPPAAKWNWIPQFMTWRSKPKDVIYGADVKSRALDIYTEWL
jgi:hypothetical protein